MRLNAWKRLGVVASVLWAVGGAIYQRHHNIYIAQDAMDSSYSTCIAANHSDYTGCMDRAQQLHEIILAGSRYTVAMFALLPVVEAWIAIYLIVWATRWILAGRRPA